MKFLPLLIFTALFIGCTSQSGNEISIAIYETIPTDKVFIDLSSCDSMLEITDNKMRKSELIEKDGHTTKRTSHRIIQMINNVFYIDNKTGIYYLTNKSIFGDASNADTTFLNMLLSDNTCKVNYTDDYYFRWVVSSNNLDNAHLLALRKQAPIMIFHNSDIDSINLVLKPNVLDLLNQIMDNESIPKSYLLNFVLKEPIVKILDSKMKSNLNAGYVGIISYGTSKYLIEIGTETIIKNTLSGITYINETKAEKLEDELGRKINLIQ
jgi:hypothetical protein